MAFSQETVQVFASSLFHSDFRVDRSIKERRREIAEKRRRKKQRIEYKNERQQLGGSIK